MSIGVENHLAQNRQQASYKIDDDLVHWCHMVVPSFNELTAVINIDPADDLVPQRDSTVVDSLLTQFFQNIPCPEGEGFNSLRPSDAIMCQ